MTKPLGQNILQMGNSITIVFCGIWYQSTAEALLITHWLSCYLMLLKTSVNHIKLPTVIEGSQVGLGVVVDPLGVVVDPLGVVVDPPMSILCSACFTSKPDIIPPCSSISELSDALSSECGQSQKHTTNTQLPSAHTHVYRTHTHFMSCTVR